MIVYAPSFAGLVQALKIVSIEKLEVISSNSSIIEFCTKYNIKNKNYNLKKPSNFKEIIKQKEFYDIKSKELIGKEVLFCFYGFDVLGLYFMYKIRKSNEVYFYNKDHHFNRISLFNLLKRKKDFKDYLVYLYVLGVSYSFFTINEKRVFFGISPKKLRKDFLELKSSLDEIVFANNKQHFSKLLNIPRTAIIFVDQGNVSFEVEDSIISWLETNYDVNEIYIKAHPNFPISNKLLKKFKEIPNFIPLDLLVTEGMELIGVYSTVLLDAVEICKVTSILNLVDWRDKSEFEKYKSIVAQSGKINIVHK